MSSKIYQSILFDKNGIIFEIIVKGNKRIDKDRIVLSIETREFVIYTRAEQVISPTIVYRISE